MKIFPKYITTFLIFVGTVSICAMDSQEQQVSRLQAVVTHQTESQVERKARWERNKNLTNLVMGSDWCKNRVMEMLGGYVGHAGDKKTYFALPVDNKLAPWILIAKQRDAIVQAAMSGDCKRLKKSCGLLDAYTSLFVSPQAPKSSDFIKNYKNNDSLTLLYTTISHEDIAMAQLLLDRGANIDIQDNEGKTPLYYSVWYEKRAMAQFLLGRGANVDIPNKSHCTPLYISIIHEDLGMFGLLLKRGASVDISDIDGQTPLYISAKSRKIEMVQLLLKHGAKVDIQNRSGDSPLSVSVLEGSLKQAELLLDRGANVDIQNKEGRTPLSVSACCGRFKQAELLLNRGASVDIQDNKGRTPLFVSVWHDDAIMVQLLLDRGANVNVSDVHGQTLDQMATKPKIKALIAQARIDRAQKAIFENQSK